MQRIEAFTIISNATKESENTKWVPMYQLNPYVVRYPPQSTSMTMT
jgi:hypothetical protein